MLIYCYSIYTSIVDGSQFTNIATQKWNRTNAPHQVVDRGPKIYSLNRAESCDFSCDKIKKNYAVFSRIVNHHFCRIAGKTTKEQHLDHDNR